MARGGNHDAQGDFAEGLATVLLAQEELLFRIHIIGGKWPAIDLYAEIRGDQYMGAFCFFQIKSTKRKRTKNQALPIQVPAHSMARLSAYNAPTYLIGIEFNTQQPNLSPAFIVSVKGTNLPAVSGMSTQTQLTGAVLRELRDEVVDFWQQTNVSATKQSFQSKF